MKAMRWTCVLLAPLLMSAAEARRDLPTFADTVQVVDDLPFVVPVDFGRPVRVRFPVGELEIAAAEVSSISTKLRVGCKRLSETQCDKYRGKLRLEGRERDRAVEVRLTGLPKWKLRRLELGGEVTVPRWAPLEVRIGIGDVEIHSGGEDLTVEMGIGELTVRAPRASVGTVRVATRIGDASLAGAVEREGRRRRLLGARIDWRQGEGAADIAVGLKIGDASVVLE